MVYTSQHTGTQVDSAVAGMLSYSGSSTDNVRMASQIGLIPNDSSKGSANAAIISSLVTAGKSLFMDKDETYYITGSGWEINYDFSIKGKGTLVFSGTVFIPKIGSSITFEGITLRGSEPTTHTYLITGSSINYVINKISFIGCTFGGFTRTVEISGADVDYNVTPLGIRDFAMENCRFVDNTKSQIILSDIVTSNSCVLKNCYVDHIRLPFFQKVDTNEFTYSGTNSNNDCDIVVNGNVVTGTVSDSSYAYFLFVLVETNRFIYINNVVSDIIGLGGPTYDMYANCNEIIYENNIVRNVCNLPQSGEIYSEIFKTKSGGKKTARNNYWTFDFDKCRQLVSSQKSVTYTDERWAEINHVMLFNYTNTVDVEFCNNHITVNGGTLAGMTASKKVRTMLFDSNVIKSDHAITGYLLPAWNDVTQWIVATNNIFRTTNTEALELFGTPYKNSGATNNARIVCKGNESNTPIMNVCSAKFSEFVFEGNSYKSFPTTMNNIGYGFLGGNEKTSRTEFWLLSGYSLSVDTIGNAMTTVHCKTTANSAATVRFGSSAHNVDLYFRGINKLYKIRDDNGTINVYDEYDVVRATIGSTAANVIVVGDMHISAYYSNSVIYLDYYNVTGYFDIDIADSSLNLFGGNVQENVIPVVSASGNTLTAEVGKYYRFDSAVTSLAVTLPAMSDTTVVKSIILSLTAGSSPSVTFSSADSKTIVYSSGYSIDAGKSYEINCLFNGSRWVIAYMTIG